MFNLENFIEECKKAVQGDNPQDRVGALMEEAFRDPEALRQALDDAAPKKDVNPLYADENLTVLRVSTPANFISPIHNHLMWVRIGILEGEEKNYLYRRTAEGGVEVEQELVLNPESGIFSLRADAIHAIETKPDQAMYGLHVYGGNILERSSRSSWHPETMEELPYDFQQIMDFSKMLYEKRQASPA